MDPLSRREFVGVSALISQAAGIGQATPSTLTAGEVVNRIKQHIGVPWRAVTVDQLIAGDESTRVQGIASVMMATQEVVERAATEGKNMIVTHETPFYLHEDKIEDIRENPVLSASWRSSTFTIIGICAIRTGSRKEWSESSAGRSIWTTPRILNASLFLERHLPNLRRDYRIGSTPER